MPRPPSEIQNQTAHVLLTTHPPSISTTATRPRTPSRPVVQGYLPIQPGLLHFVRWKERLQEGQSLQIPGRGVIASHLYILFAFGLDLMPDHYEPHDNLRVQNFTARLPFQVSGCLACHDIFHFAERVALYMDDVLYDQLQEEIFIRVACGKEAGVDGQTTIQNFAVRTGLDEYFDIESIYRSQGRLRAYRHFSIKRKPQ